MSVISKTKVRPILFSDPMVLAILDGRKTMTRREIVPQPRYDQFEQGQYTSIKLDRYGEEIEGPEVYGIYGEEWGVACRYGFPGERLWVREAWAELSWTCVIGERGRQRTEVVYRAGPHPFERDRPHGWTEGKNKWRPSIHMPRRASRITLEITEVRAERLWEITESDAIAEGAPTMENLDYDADDPCDDAEYSHVAGFVEVWKKLNGPDSWDDNPWVWVISFKRCEVD